MEIYFKNKKLEKLCNNPVKLVKAMGVERAEKLQQRLDDMDSASTLEDTRNLPGHYHELVGDRKGNGRVTWISPIVSSLSQQRNQYPLMTMANTSGVQ